MCLYHCCDLVIFLAGRYFQDEQHMVLISLNDKTYASLLEKELLALHGSVTRIESDQENSLIQSLNQKFTAIVVDESSAHINQELWHKLLKQWGASSKLYLYPAGQKLTTLKCVEQKNPLAQQTGLSEPVTFSDAPTDFFGYVFHLSPLNLAQHLAKEFSTSLSWFWQSKISVLVLHHLEEVLKQNKLLYLFYIDGDQYRSIYTEYGMHIHAKCHLLFEKSLLKALTRLRLPGYQVLTFKASLDCNCFYAFLVPDNDTVKPLAKPSDTCYSIYSIMQQHLHKDFSRLHVFKELFDFSKKNTSFSVGYAPLLYNPCINLNEQLNLVTKMAKKNSQWMRHRAHAFEKDMLVNLAVRHDLLYPRFQAIFKISDFKEADHKAVEEQNYEHLLSKLYGFESLMGINTEQVKKILIKPSHIDPHSLNPTNLFALAKKNNLSLELDQKCINLATKGGQILPGHLLINILPRNFYYIEKLSDNLPKNLKIIFEIPEDKIIKNTDLLLKMREKLGDFNCTIATDDVGRGFSNFQRLLTIKPDLIKLDRSLISGADKDRQKECVIKLFSEFAHGFSHAILAEGVETRAEFELCQKMGIHYIQGFYLHKPAKLEIIASQFNLDTSQLNEEKNDRVREKKTHDHQLSWQHKTNKSQLKKAT
ncbi:MAG: EAL domain-containing protein [Proteobacteria bacterium]|nr:EAL domain-containing protein [Pseudomonadota bacterium]